MTVELKPEHERRIHELLKSGRFHDLDEILDQALATMSCEGSPKKITEGKKTLPQLFAESPFHGLAIDFERFPDSLSRVDL